VGELGICGWSPNSCLDKRLTTNSWQSGTRPNARCKGRPASGAPLDSGVRWLSLRHRSISLAAHVGLDVHSRANWTTCSKDRLWLLCKALHSGHYVEISTRYSCGVPTSAGPSSAEHVESGVSTHSFSVRAKGLCSSEVQGGRSPHLGAKRYGRDQQLLLPRELDLRLAMRRFLVRCLSRSTILSNGTPDCTLKPKLCIGVGPCSPRKAASRLDPRAVAEANYP